MDNITASIVAYKHTQEEIEGILDQFLDCTKVKKIFIINNYKGQIYNFDHPRVKVINNRKNVGYGSAHNIAICEARKLNCDYHIASNIDVVLSQSTIMTLRSAMDNNPNIEICGPKIENIDGSLAANPRQFPSLFDMAVRMLPVGWRQKHNHIYELGSMDHNRNILGGYLSGCFIMLRLSNIDIMFDERFFMYPEDIDLSRRFGPILMVAEAKIQHVHGAESKKRFKMMLIHIINMVRYFIKYRAAFPSTSQLNRTIKYYDR